MSYIPRIGPATSAAQGIVRLAGDLGGNADAPTVPKLTSKVDTSQVGAANGLATLDANAKLTATQMPASSLASAPAGATFRCLWNGTDWTYNGTALGSNRPSTRTDIFFGYIGAPATKADPTYALTGDWREDI